MATHTPLSRAQVDALAAAYPIGPLVSFEGVPAGSVNSNFILQTHDRRYFLRVYEEQDRAGAELDARRSLALVARGVPTAPPLARTDGAHVAEVAGKPAALFAWVDGEMRCQRSVTVDACRRVGVALAQVHAAGAPELCGPSRFDVAALLRRTRRIEVDARFAEVGARLAGTLRGWVAASRPELPRGLVHGDLFRDNVLWRGDELSALLDFESASDGVLVYDLAVTALAWCFGDSLDASLLRAMVAGYESVRPLSGEERAGLFEYARLAALRFATTRVTDYAMRGDDGARVMKDYRRFLARLDALDARGPEGFARVAFG